MADVFATTAAEGDGIASSAAGGGGLLAKTLLGRGIKGLYLIMWVHELSLGLLLATIERMEQRKVPYGDQAYRQAYDLLYDSSKHKALYRFYDDWAMEQTEERVKRDIKAFAVYLMKRLESNNKGAS